MSEAVSEDGKSSRRDAERCANRCNGLKQDEVDRPSIKLVDITSDIISWTHSCTGGSWVVAGFVTPPDERMTQR